MTYKCLSCLIYHKLFSNSNFVTVSGKKLLFPLHFSSYVVISSYIFVVNVLRVIGAQYWFALSFIFSKMFRSGSAFWKEVIFNGNVCNSTSILGFISGVCVFWLLSVVESLWILANLNCTGVSRGCCQTTPGIVEFSFWWSLVCHSQFRCEDGAFLVKRLGCISDTTSYTVLCVPLLKSTLSFRFSLPRKWPVCCFGSNMTSFYGGIRSVAYLTESQSG